MGNFKIFIKTLPEDIQRKISGFKRNKQIRILKENNIEIPEFIISEIEEEKRDRRSHESVMASMECFRGNKLEDFGLKL